jgi:hypothetical protein
MARPNGQIWLLLKDDRLPAPILEQPADNALDTHAARPCGVNLSGGIADQPMLRYRG